MRRPGRTAAIRAAAIRAATIRAATIRAAAFGAVLALAALAPGLVQPARAQQIDERFNDYPTVARADYVFGCIAVNGQGRDVLEKCSCSIDVIASILPYAEYVEAEAVLTLQQASGERTSVFRSAALATEIVAKLRRAQAEAEIVCF